MVEINATSFSISRIWGSSKTTAFMFSDVSLRNFAQRYLKHSSSLSKALTNCFFTPSVCAMLVKVLLLYSSMERSLCFYLPQEQTLLYLLFSIYPVVLLCSAIPQTQEARVFPIPSGCSRNIDSTFKYTHITHSCSIYLSLSKIIFLFSYVSFIYNEHPIGT